MGDTLLAHNNILSVALYTVNSGEEFTVKKDLEGLGHETLYKVFGQYDILSLIDSKSFENSKIFTPCPRVTSSLSLSAFKYGSSGTHSPANIKEWVGNSPVLGVILLELDKWFYSAQSQPGSCLNAQLLATEKLYFLTKDIADISVFGGYGRSEMYCLVKTDRIEKLWEIANICRSLISNDCFPSEGFHENTPVFRNTQTITCLSFSCFLERYKGEEDVFYRVEGVKGKAEADIYMKCPSVFESKIEEFFPREYFECKEIFGANDVIVQTTGVVKTKIIIEAVMNFRWQWYKKYHAPIVTKTHFKQDVKSKDAVPKDYKVSNMTLGIKSVELIAIRNQSLANRIDKLLHTLENFNYSRSEQYLCFPVIRYIDYINKLIISTENCKDKEYFECENEIKHCLELAEKGLTQRVWSGFAFEGYNNTVPQPFSDGIFASLVGIEHIIRFIFNSWIDIHKKLDKSKSKILGIHNRKSSFNNYLGFAQFNDITGFAGTSGESFNLPLTALYDPIGDGGNWLTITHEISHSIYFRLNIGVRHKGFTEDFIYIGHEDGPSLEDLQLFRDHVFELFAHWYDYVHFYKKEYDRYISEMWRSWSSLSIYSIKFKDFYFRSFFIYCYHKRSELTECYLNGKFESRESWEKIKVMYDGHLKQLKEMGVRKKYLKKMQKKNIFNQLGKQTWACFGVLEKFEMYECEEFTSEINKPYSLMEEHTEMIGRGEIVMSGIKNPFALAKNVILDSDFRHLKSSIALIFSLKNCGSFYYVPEGTEEP